MDERLFGFAGILPGSPKGNRLTRFISRKKTRFPLAIVRDV
jgi:hypothetical protein